MHILIVCLLIFIVTSNCFAASCLDATVSPQYVVAQNYATTMDISSDGVATMRGALTPKNLESVDEIEMTFVLKDANGSVKYNCEHKAVWNNVFKRYEVSKTYKLSKKGSYTLQIRYDVYKDGVLLESINSKKITKSY